jgi:hypothetical protein
MPDEHGRTSLSYDSPAPGGDDGEWWNLFSDPIPPVSPPDGGRKLFPGNISGGIRIVLAGAVTVIGAVSAWAAWPSPDALPAQMITSVDRTHSEQLRDGLPSGYEPGSCDDVALDLESGEVPLAVVQCGASVARDGPDSATFTLFGVTQPMTDAFDELVSRLTVVDCPGGIQSPGPWRVSTGPQQGRGVLVCGFDADAPVVGWTDGQTRILSVVTAERPRLTMEQLYNWWSRQS